MDDAMLKEYQAMKARDAKRKEKQQSYRASKKEKALSSPVDEAKLKLAKEKKLEYMKTYTKTLADKRKNAKDKLSELVGTIAKGIATMNDDVMNAKMAELTKMLRV